MTSSGSETRSPDCSLLVDGVPTPAVTGEPVAVSLLLAGTGLLGRSIKYHRPRSFFCLSGHCGACLMRIDGQPNVRACRTAARPGLAVERQNGFPSGRHDLLAAADLVFRRGMDHHTLLTSPRPLNELVQKAVRMMGGLGRLPDERPGAAPPASRRETVDVAVVGAGPAGLAAAIACASPGRRVLVLDEASEPGGSLRSHPAHGPSAARALAARARAAGVDVRTETAAFAWYPEDEGGLLAAVERNALLRVKARRYLYATGGYDVNALFENNDRPGIFAARAVGLLLVRYRVLPGRRPIVLGNGPYAEALTEALRHAGCDADRVDSIRAVRGRRWIRSIEMEGGRRISCDVVAVAATPAPASELPRQHGVGVEWRADACGFACQTMDDGSTSAPSVFACGDVCGYRGVEAALSHGETVGLTVARSFS